MGARVRRRKFGVVVGVVVVLNLLFAAPATAGLEPTAEELAEADAGQVRAFLEALLADDPGEAGDWEWEPAPPLLQEWRFPNGEALPIVSGPVEPGEAHYDPNRGGLPLLDVSGDLRDTRLAPDVTAGELARSGRQEFDAARIDPNLVVCLQRIRSSLEDLDESVKVRSGYRSYEYNAELYRARGEEPTDSEHSSGRAMDITIEGRSGLEVARAAVEACGCELGIGVGDEFAHVDVRGEHARWSYLDDEPAEEALEALDAHREQECGGPADVADAESADEAGGDPAGEAGGDPSDGADAHDGGEPEAGEAAGDESPDAEPPLITHGITPGGLLAAPADDVEALRDALGTGDLEEAVELAVGHGLYNENQLTDMTFFVSHPELRGRQLQAGESRLAETWLRLREEVVRPALEGVRVVLGMEGELADPPGPIRSTSWVRDAWDGHACEEEVGMVAASVLGSGVQAHPETVGALAALEAALDSTGYAASGVGIYNCRDIRGRPGQRSLHAYGLAIDLDPVCHPHRVGDRGPARFSPAENQQERCRDVHAGIADTAFTPAQVEAVESIRTVDGLQVFTWGGRWRIAPDGMHFQINVSPEELRRGIR